MYEAFFELTGRPFPTTPNTEAYFPAESHEEALTLLRCGLADGEALGLLIGGPGTGKTLLCHKLIQTMDSASSLIFLGGLNDPSVESLLVAMLHDLSLPIGTGGTQKLRMTLVDFLMDRFSGGGKTVIFVDEAQNLSEEQIEELRLLTNLEGRTHKAVQILLVGQERLVETLDSDVFSGFRQRVAMHSRLSPLDDEEVAEYVRAHLSRVGGSADSMFTASAMSEFCEYSGGVPRRINQIGHRSLMLAFANGSGMIDAEFVHMAAAQLCIQKPLDRIEHHHSTLAAPRRIMTDLAFPDGAREDRSRAKSEPHSFPAPVQATVLEVGADEPWVRPKGDSSSGSDSDEKGRVRKAAEAAAPSTRYRSMFERDS